MVYEYMVKHNGVYYNAGEDVPIGASSKAIDIEPKQEVAEEVAKEEKPKTTKTKAKK